MVIVMVIADANSRQVIWCGFENGVVDLISNMVCLRERT